MNDSKSMELGRASTSTTYIRYTGQMGENLKAVYVRMLFVGYVVGCAQTFYSNFDGRKKSMNIIVLLWTRITGHFPS